jgi:hypothetical protein
MTMDITAIEATGGILSLIYVSITLILSIIIIRKFFKLKYKEFLYVGMALLGLAGPWFPEGIGFLIIIVTSGALSDLIYLSAVITIFIIFTAYLPVALIFWLSAIMRLLNFGKRRLILMISIMLSVFFEVIFFTFSIIDLNLIGTFIDAFHSRESPFILAIYLGSMGLLLVTTIIFSSISMKSENSKIKLKGILFLMGIITFLVGGLIATLATDITFLIISRAILVICSILLYLGLLLPKRILNIFKVSD